MRRSGLSATVVALFALVGLLASPALAIAQGEQPRSLDHALTQSEEAVHSQEVSHSGSESEADAAADSTAVLSTATVVPLSENVNKLHAQVYIPSKDGKVGFVFKKRTGGWDYCEQTSFRPCGASQHGEPAASATLSVGMTINGWDQLSLTTNAKFPDRDQAYAAGFLEGALTWERISAFADAWILHRYTGTQKKVIDEYIDKQDAFLRKMVVLHGTDAQLIANAKDSKYWYHVGLVLQQMDGMLDGYNRNTKTMRLTRRDMWLINDDGDVMDIERFAGKRRNVGMRFKSVNDMSIDEVTSFLELTGRCTALIKWTGQDLFVGHTTWSDYQELLRVYKHYNLNYKMAVAKKVSFSSYPGMVYSSDDFYILDSGLVIMETTINILNEKLYSKCDPSKSVVTVVRSLVANLLAANGKEWAEIFGHYNSGTYNNQWMVVDMNQFTPGAASLAPNTLWVVEQIPTRVVARDLTPVLQQQTYWGSYNRPYFREINEESMFRKFTDQHGESFSYQGTARAKIIAREQKAVNSLERMMALLRHNDYKNDPLSKGCPYKAIAARFDLPPTPKCPLKIYKANGAADAKVTSYLLQRQLKAQAVSGPSRAMGLPAFDWRTHKDFKNLRSIAMPSKFDFGWEMQHPVPVPKPAASHAAAEEDDGKPKVVAVPAKYAKKARKMARKLARAQAEGRAIAGSVSFAEADAASDLEAEAEVETETETDADAQAEADAEAAGSALSVDLDAEAEAEAEDEV